MSSTDPVNVSDENLAGPDTESSLAAIYRHIGNNMKIGVGYNFTDFSDDLTDLRYNHKGVFFNFVETR